MSSLFLDRVWNNLDNIICAIKHNIKKQTFHVCALIYFEASSPSDNVRTLKDESYLPSSMTEFTSNENWKSKRVHNIHGATKWQRNEATVTTFNLKHERHEINRPWLPSAYIVVVTDW